MKSVMAFWKKDIINKLIILVSTVLVVGTLVMVYLVINIKSDSVFYAIFSPFLGLNSEVPTMVVVPTATPTELSFSMPTFTPFPETLPVTPTPNLPSPTVELATSLPIQPTATVAVSVETPTLTSAMDAGCIPSNPPQTGKVLDVIDGNTIKVLIGGVAYTVRYIGIDVPRFKPVADYFGQEADFKNAEFVFAKVVTLIPDVKDRDEAGRLLRYVKVGDVFVNLEMVIQGFASASSGTFACEQTFRTAGLTATKAQIGIWKPTPTP
jgi:micrococcal nuclease